MPPAISTNWQDLLDSRFSVLFNDRYRQLQDMIAEFYTMKGPGDTPTKDALRVSQAGAFGDVPEFLGTVTYDDVYQGYDSTITPQEYATLFRQFTAWAPEYGKELAFIAAGPNGGDIDWTRGFFSKLTERGKRLLRLFSFRMMGDTLR